MAIMEGLSGPRPARSIDHMGDLTDLILEKVRRHCATLTIPTRGTDHPLCFGDADAAEPGAAGARSPVQPIAAETRRVDTGRAPKGGPRPRPPSQGHAMAHAYLPRLWSRRHLLVRSPAGLWRERQAVSPFRGTLATAAARLGTAGSASKRIRLGLDRGAPNSGATGLVRRSHATSSISRQPSREGPSEWPIRRRRRRPGSADTPEGNPR